MIDKLDSDERESLAAVIEMMLADLEDLRKIRDAANFAGGTARALGSVGSRTDIAQARVVLLQLLAAGTRDPEADPVAWIEFKDDLTKEGEPTINVGVHFDPSADNTEDGENPACYFYAFKAWRDITEGLLER